MVFRLHQQWRKVQGMKPEGTIPLVVPTGDQSRAGSGCLVHSDNIVGRLGEFPELAKAVRENDLAEIGVLCGQLFDLSGKSPSIQALVGISSSRRRSQPLLRHED
jgi:hypothetical protein